MAISGATKADALAGARRLGKSVADMNTLLNVSSVAPTLTATGGVGQVVLAWTNIDGVKTVDVGDGVLREYAPAVSGATVTGLTPGTRTARIWGAGVSKASGSYTVT